MICCRDRRALTEVMECLAQIAPAEREAGTAMGMRKEIPEE